MSPESVTRFWAKVSRSTACWHWTAAKNSRGYGSFGYGGRTYLAHRIAYALTYGEIPVGMEINHVCGVKSCVNPLHLEVVTAAQNIQHARASGLMPASKLSRRNAAKVACANGHGYTPENTYTTPKGHRVCRECKRASGRRRLQRIAGRSA